MPSRLIPTSLRSGLAAGLLVAALLGASPAAAAADLTVSAAASLRESFGEIAKAFEKAEAGTRVLLNVAASGALLQQIARGAPVDVFASADLETMDAAELKGLLQPGSRRNVAANALVVVVPADAAPVPATLAALAAPSFRRIAIGVPASVPVGRYTEAVLVKAGLWPTLQARTVGAQSVRQVLDYVARGEVDAGFVYATDAALMPAKVKLAFKVPTDSPVLYPIAVLAASAQPDAARRFVAFVGSPAGQAVLARHGFAPP